MDPLLIFPILLAFMIAVLTALGYALHRLAETPNGGNVLSAPVQQCPRCQHALNISWSHCPACGAPLATDAVRGAAVRPSNGASPIGTTHRSQG